MTIIEFLQRFPSEKDAINHFFKIRYNNVITCPHCNSKEKIYRYRNRFKFAQCKKCNNTFSVFTGTIFEHSSTDIRKWFYAIHLFLNAKKGISGYQLKREIGVTYKTAWRILKQIRIAMGNKKEKDVFETIVEIDETYVGGKPRRYYDNDNKIVKNPDVIHKRGRGTKKIPVVGIKDRITGKIHAKVMLPNDEGKKLTGKQLISVLDSVCKNKVTVISDDFRGYDILDKKTDNNYQRYTVNHSIGQYSAGKGIHTNGIENFWSIFKRGWYGIYHHMSVKYLQNYVNEYCFRNNNRGNNQIYDVLLRQSVLLNNTA